jgi:hypothetical protein
MKGLFRRETWLFWGLFLLYAVLRFFRPTPDHFIHADEAKYLCQAETFPACTLWNRSLWLMKPPGGALFFWAGARMTKDPFLGAFVASFIASLFLFPVVLRIFGFMGESPPFIWMALLPLTCSRVLVGLSSVAYHESIALTLSSLTLLFFLRGLCEGGGWWKYAAWSGALFAWCKDDVPILLATLFLAVPFFKERRCAWWKVGGVFAAILACYLAWGGVRWIKYRSADFLPAGGDGLVEETRNFPWAALISPNYLPETAKVWGTGFGTTPYLAFNFLKNLFEPVVTVRDSIDPWPFMAGLVRRGEGKGTFGGLVLLFAVLGCVPLLGGLRIVREAVRGRGKGNSAGPYFVLLALILMAPIAFGRTGYRHSIYVWIPYAYLFAAGWTHLVGGRVAVSGWEGKRALGGVLVAIGTVLFWRPVPLWAVRPTVEAGRTAAYVRTLPEDGVMVMIYYSPEIAYLSGKRVIGMPRDPAVLDRQIQQFGIRYLVCGERYRHVSPEVYEWIERHPRRYVPIETIEEAYPDPYKGERMTVYRVEESA